MKYLEPGGGAADGARAAPRCRGIRDVLAGRRRVLSGGPTAPGPGEGRWFSLPATLRRGRAGPGGQPLEDITPRKAAEQRLVYAATHDELTGLLSRALFADRLGCAARRPASRRDWQLRRALPRPGQLQGRQRPTLGAAGDDLVAIAR